MPLPPPSAAAAADARRQQQQQRMADVPDLIVDKDRNLKFHKGKFLGKGGFAHCYELRNMTSGEIVAGKIVSKTLLVKQYQRDKMAQEVQIHRDLRHENVVRLFSFFEDTKNVYITLELCSRRSLMELHKRRKAVTDPEARYYTVQVCKAVDYLHDKRIIHRDLKLGNLFLNEEMVVKIGDFGLATTVGEGERKKTLCGTPNYIAPEVLEKKGHSFEVDVWAIGCILYTLLFGKPPFETESLKDTYARIKGGLYRIPTDSPPEASSLIRLLLAGEPAKRPNIKQALSHEYFQGFTPRRLPVSCLSMAPKFGLNTSVMPPPDVPLKASSMPSGSSSMPPNHIQSTTSWTATAQLNPLHNRHPFSPQNRGRLGSVPEHRPVPSSGASSTGLGGLPPAGASQITLGRPGSQLSGDVAGVPVRYSSSEDYHLAELHHQVHSLIKSRILERPEAAMLMEDEQSPEAVPVFWIAKWVDYSDKYGIGYTLCDNSVGVLFNDNTKLVLDEAGTQLTYIEKTGRELYYNMQDPPNELSKKVTLLNYFRSYMNEHLIKAGQLVQRREGDDLARLPVLQFWFRTKSAMVLHLTNGTLQINFFHDHIKMVLCPLMQAVTFIDQEGAVRTYKLIDLQRQGCSKNQLARLRYASTMVDRLLNQCNGAAGIQTARSNPGSSERRPSGSQPSSSQQMIV